MACNGTFENSVFCNLSKTPFIRTNSIGSSFLIDAKSVPYSRSVSTYSKTSQKCRESKFKVVSCSVSVNLKRTSTKLDTSLPSCSIRKHASFDVSEDVMDSLGKEDVMLMNRSLVTKLCLATISCTELSPTKTPTFVFLRCPAMTRVICSLSAQDISLSYENCVSHEMSAMKPHERKGCFLYAVGSVFLIFCSLLVSKIRRICTGSCGSCTGSSTSDCRLKNRSSSVLKSFKMSGMICNRSP